MAKTPDEKHNEMLARKKKRDEVRALLKSYLEFRTGLTLEITEGELTYPENTDQFHHIENAYCLVNQNARSLCHSSFKGRHLIRLSPSIESLEKLEKKILSDKEFMTSREASKTDLVQLVPNDAINPSFVMESVGDENEQVEAVTGLAGKIHHHITAINALRTQAVNLGLTPAVDKLVAKLNADRLSR